MTIHTSRMLAVLLATTVTLGAFGSAYGQSYNTAANSSGGRGAGGSAIGGIGASGVAGAVIAADIISAGAGLEEDAPDSDPEAGQMDQSNETESFQALEQFSIDKLDRLNEVLQAAGFNSGSALADPNLIIALFSTIGQPERLDDEDDEDDWYHGAIAAVRDQGNAGGQGGPGRDIPPNVAEILRLVEQMTGGNPPPSPPPPNPPSKPPEYPYFERREFTPFGVDVQGNYAGRVTGTTASGMGLDGTANFDLTFLTSGPGVHVDIDGNFDFGSHGVVNITQLAPTTPVGFHFGGQSFLGGTITATNHTSFDLYGPTGEQYGGDWGFVVSGGSDPGLVQGQFVTSRLPK